MLNPEWAGYLAAFDVYVDACNRGDVEHQEQAKLVMGWFAEELLHDDPDGKLSDPRTRRRLTRDISSLTDLLGL